MKGRPHKLGENRRSGSEVVRVNQRQGWPWRAKDGWEAAALAWRRRLWVGKHAMVFLARLVGCIMGQMGDVFRVYRERKERK